MAKSNAVKSTRARNTKIKKAAKRKPRVRKVRKVAVQRISFPWPQMYGWGAASAGEKVESLLHMDFPSPDMTGHVVRTTKIARGPKAAEGCLTIREWVGKQIDAGSYTRAQIISRFKLAYPHANQSQGGRYVTSAFNPTYCFKRWGKKAQKNDKGVISWVTK